MPLSSPTDPSTHNADVKVIEVIDLTADDPQICANQVADETMTTPAGVPPSSMEPISADHAQNPQHGGANVPSNPSRPSSEIRIRHVAATGEQGPTPRRGPVASQDHRARLSPHGVPSSLPSSAAAPGNKRSREETIADQNTVPSIVRRTHAASPSSAQRSPGSAERRASLQLKRVQDELAALKSDKDNEDKSNKVQVEELKREIKELKIELAKSRELLEAEKKRADDAKTKALDFGAGKYLELREQLRQTLANKEGEFEQQLEIEKTRADEAEAAANAAQHAAQQAENELARAVEDRKELMRKYKTKKDRAASLEKELSTEQAKTKDAEGKLNAEKDKATAAETRASAAEQNLIVARQRIAAAEQKATAAEQTATHAKGELVKLQNIANTAQAAATAAERRAKSAEATNAVLRQSITNSDRLNKTKQDKLDGELRLANGQIEKLRQHGLLENRGLAEELRKAKADCQSANHKNTRMETQVNRLNIRLSEMQTRLTQAEASAATSATAELQARVEELEARVAAAEARATNAENTLESREADFVEHISALEDELNDALDRNNLIAAELARFRPIHPQSQSEIEEGEVRQSE